MAYYELEPWGEERDDLRTGVVASTIVNMNKTKGSPSKPSDFLLNFDKEKDKQSWEEQMRLMRMATDALSGKPGAAANVNQVPIRTKG